MTTAKFFRHDLTVVQQTAVGKLLFALAVGAPLGGVLIGFVLSNGPLTSDFLVFSLWLVAGTVLPLGALLTAAITITADRESGRIRLLFATPLTKLDVFAGTLLSRVAVTCLAAVVGFGLTGLVLQALSIDLTRELTVLAGFTILCCVVYTSIGIAVSAVSSTRLRAVGVAIAFYVFSAFWPQLVSQIGEPGGPRLGEPTPAETMTHFVGTLSPFGAYSQIVTPGRAIYAEPVSGPLLATPTMAAILAVWAVLPVLVGYWWFSQVDV